MNRFARLPGKTLLGPRGGAAARAPPRAPRTTTAASRLAAIGFAARGSSSALVTAARTSSSVCPAAEQRLVGRLAGLGRGPRCTEASRAPGSSGQTSSAVNGSTGRHAAAARSRGDPVQHGLGRAPPRRRRRVAVEPVLEHVEVEGRQVDGAVLHELVVDDVELVLS